MKNYLVLPLFVLLSNFSLAQITFQRTYGGIANEEGSAVLETHDSGYVIVGITNSQGAGNRDIFLIKTDLNGDTIWTKTYGGFDNDIASHIQQTSDGGYVITGYTKSFGIGDDDVFIIKTDSAGNVSWTKTYGGPNSSDIANDIIQTSDGGYMIAGSTTELWLGNEKIFLIKTDSNGDTLWTKIYHSTEMLATSIHQVSDGGYVIGGTWIYDLLLAKTDSLGTIQWAKSYGGTGNDYGKSMQPTQDGGYIMAGSSYSFPQDGALHILVAKTDSAGNLLWSKSIDESFSFCYETASEIQQTRDGGYIVTGYTCLGSGDVYLVKMNSSGNLLWSRRYYGINPNQQYGNAIHQTGDDGFIICGKAEIVSGQGNVYLIKTDSLGISGCNQSIPANHIFNPAVQVGTGNPSIFLQSTYITIPLWQHGSGTADTAFCLPVGENEIKFNKSRLSVFPNPAQHQISIKSENDILHKVTIFDLNGRETFSCSPMISEVKIAVNLLAPGIYFVSITTNETVFHQSIEIIK